jgi:hypothetical protein
MLYPKDIAEFQRLWSEHYDEELSQEQARKYAESLLRYVQLVMSPEDKSSGTAFANIEPS